MCNSFDVAKPIRQLDTWVGNAILYRLDIPTYYETWEKAENGDCVEMQKLVEFVIVSSVTAYDGVPETYIFPSDETGDAICMIEMRGSYKGGLNHAEALRGLGYRIGDFE